MCLFHKTGGGSAFETHQVGAIWFQKRPELFVGKLARFGLQVVTQCWLEYISCERGGGLPAFPTSSILMIMPCDIVSVVVRREAKGLGHLVETVSACVHVCARARVRACVRVCVCMGMRVCGCLDRSSLQHFMRDYTYI